MCYTGQCRYEGYMGDCSITDNNYPDDAGCVIAEMEQEALYKRTPIKGYCDGCEKIKDNLCTVWANVCKRTGADRGGYIGCPFSPLETTEVVQGRKRVGQQKTKSGRS